VPEGNEVHRYAKLHAATYVVRPPHRDHPPQRPAPSERKSPTRRGPLRLPPPRPTLFRLRHYHPTPGPRRPHPLLAPNLPGAPRKHDSVQGNTERSRNLPRDHLRNAFRLKLYDPIGFGSQLIQGDRVKTEPKGDFAANPSALLNASDGPTTAGILVPTAREEK
jgi:hypothetical protein